MATAGDLPSPAVQWTYTRPWFRRARSRAATAVGKVALRE
jgi:hypothetical protein